MKNVSPTYLFITLSLLAFSFIMILHSCEPDASANAYQNEMPAPIEFSSSIPVDVNPQLQEKLKKEGNFFGLNEAFNEYSWKALIAINWPTGKNGEPLPNFTDKGSPAWLGWKEAFEVYLSDGRKPAPWGSPRISRSLLGAIALKNRKSIEFIRSKSNLSNDGKLSKEEGASVLFSTVTPTHPANVVDESEQAFAGKLFDQNGNVVVYEVLMNEEEFDYIVQNTLYNINGQLKFTKESQIANFPKGNFAKDSLGAVEIKIAWKILEDSDHKDRYFKDEGFIINDTTGAYEKKDLGMIGFHISQKTPTAKQWVWSTFEHIDNLDQNIIEKDGKSVVIHPSLTDPSCEICPVNVDYTQNNDTTFHSSIHGDYWTDEDNKHQYFANGPVMKTQAKRMVDIPVRVQRINKKMQSYFKQQNSVWQYYQLVDTQFPLDQNAAPTPDQQDNYVIPKSVTNKPGGDPNIALLTNISMETFFQDGNQSATNLMEDNPISPIAIFGTESCMGCHSSAGIYISIDSSGKPVSGPQLSGDFSWLLSRASWEKGIPKPKK